MVFFAVWALAGWFEWVMNENIEGALARPFIGAAVVPIVLFLRSGLINLGSATPALALALCFVGGFSERWFVAQVERLAGGSEGRAK